MAFSMGGHLEPAGREGVGPREGLALGRGLALRMGLAFRSAGCVFRASGRQNFCTFLRNFCRKLCNASPKCLFQSRVSVEHISGTEAKYPTRIYLVYIEIRIPVRELTTKTGSTIRHLCGLWRVLSGWIRRDLFALRRGGRSRLACCRSWSVGLPLAVLYPLSSLLYPLLYLLCFG